MFLVKGVSSGVSFNRMMGLYCNCVVCVEQKHQADQCDDDDDEDQSNFLLTGKVWRCLKDSGPG